MLFDKSLHFWLIAVLLSLCYQVIAENESGNEIANDETFEQQVDNDNDKLVDGELEPENSEPYLDVIIKGHHIRAPYYEGVNVTKLSKDRREFDNRVVAGLNHLMMNITVDMIVHQKTWGLSKYLISAVSFATGNKNEFDKLIKEPGNGPPTKPDFIKHSLGMTKEVLNGGIGAYDERRKKDLKENNNKPLTDKQEVARVLSEMREKMDIIEEAIKKSPVGMYIDWNELTYDNETIAKTSAYYVDYVRVHHSKFNMLNNILNSVMFLF